MCIRDRIVPVDSEHSAIFQCLQGCRDRGEIKRLILTCSGGPFYGLSAQELATKTKADALKHPNWTMGAKITIDSATLMNKGLEIIEAMRLYRLPLRQVDAVIHRQSIVHSLVEFHDGAMLAQLGTCLLYTSKYSTIAHGFVKSVDKSAAEAIPGVVKVLTCFEMWIRDRDYRRGWRRCG